MNLLEIWPLEMLLHTLFMTRAPKLRTLSRTPALSPDPYRPIVRWRRQHPLFSKPLPSCSANGARTRPEALRKPGGGCKGIQKGHKDDTCSG